MTRKFTFTILAMLFAILGPGAEAWGQEKADTYERLTSIANIDESAQYVLGIDGTGFHYEGTSSWGKTALPSAQTPLYYTLKKATDGQSFTAQTEISNTTYYLQIPTSNTFGMATSTGTNTDLIIGTTLSNAGDGANYAVTNKSTTTRHIRRNGDSGLRSYASTTGAIAFFYKVVKDEKTLVSIAISGTPKTTYETGESFDVTDLTVTGTYSDASTGDLTDAAEWTFDPATFTSTSQTSVSVTATVDGKSDTKNYDVTVNAIEGDRLTLASTGVSGSSYTAWSGKTGSEGVAVYAGKSAGSNNAIQLNNTNPNGIVSTTSAGLIKKVKVDWESHTSDGRYITIYGSNTAYTSSADVYDTEKQGTSLGTIKKGTNTELTITGDYAYVGVKANGALYMNSITFIWSAPKELVSIAVKTAPTTVNYAAGEFFNPAGLEITATYDDASTEDITYEGNEDKFSFSPALDVALATTDEQVTITYGGKSCDQTITVKNIELTSIVVSGDLSKTEYTEGDDFDFTGLVATGYYSDESNKNITDQVEWSIDPATLTAGQTSVKVIATMNEISGDKTYDITVAAAPLEVTWDASQQGYSNEQAVTEAEFNAIINAEFEGGKYYITGTAVRVYSGKTFAIHAVNGYKITSIVIGFGTGDGSNTITADCGTYSSGTWTGSAKDVTFTVGGTSGNRRLKTFTVTYAVAAPAVATPTITPSAETCWEPITVTLATETEGATIYYTTDGTEPTTTSDLYKNPIEVSKTTTIKAIAVKDGFDNSEIASATYTFPITLAAVRQQASGNVFTKGVVSWASDDKKNAYIQDATGGLYVYSSNAFNDLIADNEIALKGSLTSYNGLLEIKPTEIIKISGGNTVTAVVKTIYEINADAEDKNTLQGVKVTVENAEVTTGATTSGTAVIKQGENSLNFYHPSVDLAVGDVVTITAIVGNYNGVQLVNGFGITFAPVIDVEEEFTTFSYTVGNGPSDAQEFLFEGKNLKGNVTITASDNFEICEIIDGEYTPSLTITAKNGIVNGNAYIRLKAGLDANNYEGTLTLSTTGLENIVINLAGQVTQNQTFSITIDENIENGSVVAKISDIEVDIAEAGAEVTLIATPDEHYQLVKWNVTCGSEEITVTDNKFTMPENNVVVSATFSQKTVNITYSVNGDVAALVPATVGEGDEITLPTPDAENIPTGFDFAGWSLSESSTTTIGETYIVNENVNLYAVFSRVEGGTPGSGNYEKVTSLSDIVAGKYIITATKDGTEYTMKNDKVSAKGLLAYSLESQNLSVENNTIVGDATNNTWTFAGTNSSMTITSTKETPTCYLYATATNNGMVVGTSTSDTWSFTAVDNTDLFYMKDSNQNRYLSLYDSQDWRCYSNTNNGVPKLALYKKDEGTPGTTHYYTRVFSNETATAAITIAGPTIIPAGSILNMGSFKLSNDNAANLIIEDGGQLILNEKNTGVMATVKKQIEASNTHTGEPVDKWYTIGSPVKEPIINGSTGNYVADIIPAGGMSALTYNLYYLDMTAGTWINYRQKGDTPGFTTLENGCGYIYSNQSATTVKYVGELNTANVNRSVNTGWNLVSNPFAQTIAFSNFKLDNSASMVGYYSLDGAGGWQAEPITTDVASNTGILVNVPEGASSIEISKPAKAIENNGAKRGDSNDNAYAYIEINVANANYSDRAYAAFAEGYGLPKYDHINAEIQKVYIPQGGEDFAIAMMDENVTLFPVSFKAMTTGNYSISLKPTDDVSTLVLVDNMTGEETNMLLEDSYTFIGSPRDNENRFTVKFTISHNDGQSDSEHFAYQNGSELVINGEGTLQIFDVLGRMVISEEVHGQTVNVGGLNTGAYIVRLTGESVKTQKIVVR